MQSSRSFLTFILFCACSAKVMNVGSNADGGDGMGGSSAAGGGGAAGGQNAGAAGLVGPMSPPWPSDSDCQSGTQLPIVGNWSGYVESYQFASGSDAIQVTITAANDAHVCGKVTFGQGTPPAPPTDPNIGYPPSLVASLSSTGAAGAPNLDMNSEGYPMTMLNGTASTARLQFQVNQRELWKTWCEMQTPYLAQAGTDFYMCVPNVGWTTGPNGSCVDPNGHPIDCAKEQLCESRICTCNAAGCTVTPTGNVSFDLHVQNADHLSGSANISNLHNVYLDHTP